MKQNKKIVFSLITLFIVFVIFEAFSYSGLYFLTRFKRVNYIPIFSKEMSKSHQQITAQIVKNQINYVQIDNHTGWSIAPNKNSGLYQSNSQGFRGDQDYPLTPPQDRIRIATFGNSFTHCDDVNNNETWEYYMEQDNPHFQILNFGVGGFGLGQAYLRYQSLGKKFNSDVVLIGFMPENIQRVMSIYRPFYISGTKTPFAKPRFKQDGDQLTLIPSPLKSAADYGILLSHTDSMFSLMGNLDYHYQTRYHQGPFDFLALVRFTKMVGTKLLQKDGITDFKGNYIKNSEALNTTVKIFETFYNEVLQEGKLPIIVIIASSEDVIRYHNSQELRYQPLLDNLKALNLNYIDGLIAFQKDSSHTPYADYFSGHYSPLGNKLVSQFYMDEINRFIEKQPLNRVLETVRDTTHTP